MLMPQKLTAWVPTTSTVINYIGYATSSQDNANNLTIIVSDNEQASSSADKSLSYLAIDCEIYHSGIKDADAKIHDGYIFVPFETSNLNYAGANVDEASSITDEWLAGYKITYCLNFGGGYIVEEGHSYTLPEPGCIPDTETFTLRTISYTTTIDAWEEVAASQDLDSFENGDTDTSGS